MAFTDTYGDSKRAAQQAQIQRDAQTMQGFQALADFIQRGQQNRATNAYNQQQLIQNAPYKQAMTQRALAQTDMYQQRANGAGMNTIPQDDQIVVGQYANGQPIIKSKKAMQQIAQMQAEAQRNKEIERIKNRKLTKTEADSLSQIDSVKNDLEILKKGVGSQDETLSYLPFGAGQKGAQDFRLSYDRLNNLLVYLKSGAAINEQEFKRLKGLLPKMFRQKDVDVRAIQAFQDELGKKAEYIRYGTLNSEAVGNGYDDLLAEAGIV